MKLSVKKLHEVRHEADDFSMMYGFAVSTTVDRQLLLIWRSSGGCRADVGLPPKHGIQPMVGRQ